MSEEEARKAADNLHDAILVMETLYEDIVKYLANHAKETVSHSHAYALLERAKENLFDIGSAYTTIAKYTNE